MNKTCLLHTLAFGLLLALCAASLRTMAAPAPVRVLLITGGCCHDYAIQKDLLKKGLEERANLAVDQVYSEDTSTHPPLPIVGHPEYATGYEVVIHDECASDIADETKVQGVLQPHREGIPGVNLHCGMHSYRIGNPNEPVTPGTPHGLWFEYLGLQSSRHGPQLPIAITFTAKDNPIVTGLRDWTTVNEELYNNIHVFQGAQPLARGKQIIRQKDGSEKTDDFVVVWTNEYGPKKTKVFSTTIGHNNATVGDSRYLDLVTRGVLWATGHLKIDGTATEGYWPRLK